MHFASFDKDITNCTFNIEFTKQTIFDKNAVTSRKNSSTPMHVSYNIRHTFKIIAMRPFLSEH